MKKTLAMAAIALGALCLSAQAGDVTFTYGQDGTMDSSPADTVVTGISDSWTMWLSDGTKQTIAYKSDMLGNNTSMPSVVISEGAKWQYTLTFTPVADMTTDSIKVALSIANSANGASIGLNHSVKTTGTLSGYGINPSLAVHATGTNSRPVKSDTYTLDADWTAITSGSGTILTYNLGGSKTLTAGQEYSFSVLVELGSKDPGNATDQTDFFVGLDGIRFNTVEGSNPNPVPEPATATLSLLALTGLAARRRRK